MNYFTYKQDDFVKVDPDGRKVLGVDINPDKGCIFNCVICLRGQTKKQGEWHDFGPIEDSLSCLKKKIQEENPDLIEIYGQGDVLTNVHLEEVIDFVHAQGLPVRLVTNCYLLGIGEHMRAACKCDEVVGAFGLTDDSDFQKIHRPLKDLNFTAEKQNESIIRFSQEFSGKFTLRVFLVKGYNDSDEKVAQIKEVLKHTRYDSLWVVTTPKLTVDDVRVKEISDYLNG